MTRTITLNINGEIFKLDVESEEEEVYRVAAQQLNEVIGNYGAKYVSASYTKILSMVALDMSLNLAKSEKMLHEAEERLAQIEGALDCDEKSPKSDSMDLLSY